ncbi:proteinase-activated receptor 3-like [Hypanus sabinus]|uniref:proteinase-activated receptor 3-like n=1 Tax=Hypanus sabinus TaxID=79690 RepID=UPI0028C494A7|nr:proteinase-activated receptor 3-like [Hypanus sabinus]
MKLLTAVQALVLVTLLGCVINCCATGKDEVCRKKEVGKTRKFLIVQVFNPATNKTINTFNDSSMQHLKSNVTRVLIPYFFLVVFIIGLPANGLALWVLIARIKQLPSTFLLINLALADLLVLISLPWRIAYHLLGNNWVFGEAFCRISTALLYGNIYSSILFLTCIGADRYLAIVHPFVSKAIRSNTAVHCVCGGVWLVLVLSMVPHYITKQSYWIDPLNITLCNDAFPIETQEKYRPYLICQVLFGFMLPCLIVVFCYISIISTLAMNDMKYGHAIMATLLVLLVFLVCLTPFNVTLLVQIYTQSSDVYYYTMICLVASTLSNCIDPFIYYYISEEFRNKLTGLLTAYRTETGSGKSDQSLLQSSNQPQPNPPRSV